MIYFGAAFLHRKRTRTALKRIRLGEENCVTIIFLLISLVYVASIWWKGSLNLWDAAILTAIYATCLLVLSKLPPEQEGIDELERIPRSIVLSPRPRRIAIIAGFFAAGAALIYFAAEPFLGSLLALSAVVGIPSFRAIQWVAPFVSEFPEMASTFYFARTVRRAPMALMNMVSSNINQWTLLTAMLPVVYSISRGSPSSIPF